MRVCEQLGKNEKAHLGRVAEQDEMRAAITDLAEQVEGVRTGRRLEEAMGTLKNQIRDEKQALRKQLSEMEGRLADANGKLAELNEADKVRTRTIRGSNRRLALRSGWSSVLGLYSAVL